MREYKFRGKREDNGEWVFGSFIPDALERSNSDLISWGFIRRHNRSIGKMETIEVDRETVGQYTGLKDKNGVDIYEGDTLAMPIDENPQERDVCDVRWCEKAAAYRVYFQPNNHEELYLDDIEPEVYSTIIGNIHEGVTE